MGMSDARTIAVYDARAQTYSDLVSRTTPDADLQAFLDAMPEGGRALDLGCGPGNSAAMMHDAGLEVEAWDASAQMVQLARKAAGVTVRKATFDALDAVDVYDGVWANFSLLHAPKPDMPRHLAAIRQAVKPGGLFHIGLKTGQDTARDRLGRIYAYYTVPEITALIEAAGFTPRRIREGVDTGLSGEMAPFVVILSDG
jgi:SAM-dependent methyltransferase